MTERDRLELLLREHGGLVGLAREIGQGDPTDARGSVPSIKPGAPLGRRTVRWLLQRDAVEVLFVMIAAGILAWFAWTLL